VLPLLPWTLATLSIALLAGAAALWWLNRKRNQIQPLPAEWALTARPVFTADERRVYRQLREALPHHIVLSKLPLVRFCQPSDPQEVRYWYGLLGSLHVGFAVCSANGRVLAAIDLEGERGSSRRTLQIKQSVLTACRVRYLRCAPDQLPSIPELQLLVPQSASTTRGPQAAPLAASPEQVRELLAGTVAQRRRERTTLWQDSGFLQDSFFGREQHSEFSVTSGFGALRPPPLAPELRPLPADAGGVVIETRAAAGEPKAPPLRH
jgi:hypothetical protein